MVKQGSLSEQTISFTDMLSTLAELTGDDLPGDVQSDSHSFLPVLRGIQPEDQPIRPPVVLRSASGAWMIRSGDWKLIDQLGSGGFSEPKRVEPGEGGPTAQLYNLAEDPGETNNLFLEHPEIADRLKTEMKQILDN
jgi:arylsulfatase A-like enzyme